MIGAVGRIAVLVETFVTGGGAAVARLVVVGLVVVGLVLLVAGLVVVGVALVIAGVVLVVVDVEGDRRVAGGCTTSVPFVAADVVLFNNVTS